MTTSDRPTFNGKAKVNFRLRPWQESDLDSLVEFADNRRIAQFLTNGFPHPYTRSAGEKFIQMVSSHTPLQVFAIEINGIASGGIGIHPQVDIMCKNMEMGYWLAEPLWGNGIISAAIPLVVEYGFKAFDVTRIFARPFGSNVASQRVLEKNGFVLEAHFKKTIFKNGEFMDELIYAKRKTDLLP
jgi:RimJ/RimL family protein N-acetyltransferase